WQRFGGVDGNDPAQGRVQIRPKDKHRPFVVDEIVLGVGLAQQLNYFGLWIDQVFVKDAVLWIGTALHGNDEIAAIVGDFSIEKPFLLIGTLVDQFVLRLLRAESGEEKFGIVNLRAKVFFF